MTSDNEVVTFEFYSISQSARYIVEFDATFDLDIDNNFGNLLDNFYAFTIIQSKKFKLEGNATDIADTSEFSNVGLEIAEIIDRFLQEKPNSPIFFKAMIYEMQKPYKKTEYQYLN